jgi:hypothetical protein
MEGALWKTMVKEVKGHKMEMEDALLKILPHEV